MDAVRIVLLFLHVGGMAVLLGGFGLELMGGTKRFSAVIFHMVGIQLVTGLLLVGADEADDRDLNYAKVATKLVIALAVTGLVHATRKRDPLPPALFFGAFALAASNAVIAYAWR
ncbi:MAG TPA: hypothetical protein VMZ00_00910 [Sporichthya sp.]|nr:hypothetical protein [Sporichthya sp.]